MSKNRSNSQKKIQKETNPKNKAIKSERPDHLSETESSMEKKDELWHEIGFVRPLGGLLYNIMLVLGGSVFGIAFSIWLLPNVIYPFPSAMGWESMTKSLFTFYFAVADVGLGTAIQRFIGEQNIKNPRKSIQYLQFFIYFQMFTGLIQITALSFWVMGAATEGDLAYASWFFLLYSTIQWPGMLGVFKGALESYQRFDRANMIAFIQAILLENTTRIILIIAGRYWGKQNPMIGELMGATIGSIIGAYVDDFLAAVIAAKWTVPILKEIDPEWGFLRLFHVDFDWELARECLLYGFKIMLQGVIFPAANLISVFILKDYLPNYPTIWGIYLIAEMIGTIVGGFGFNITSSFSEAYNNEKYRLAGDYLTRSYRWITLLGSLLVGLLFTGASLIGVIAGERFYLAVPLIQAFIIFKVMESIIKLHDKVFRGGDKPEYNIVVLIVEQTSRLIFLYIFLVPIPLSGMAIVLSRGLGWIVKWFVSYFLIQKRMLKFTINLWQTIVVPLGAAFLEAITIYLIKIWLFPIFSQSLPQVFAAVLTLIIGLLVGPFSIWLPVYALLGGWDKGSLEILKKALIISGPSKPFVRFILKVSVYFSEKSPFFEKFPIDTTGVQQEIGELINRRRDEIQQIKE